MSRKTQTGAGLQDFRKELVRQEKSSITVEKYLRDAGRFLEYLKGRKLCKESILGFKQNLIDAGYMVRSINSMLAAVNSYLSFLGKRSLRVKALRTQREVYRPEARELKKAEYMRLLEAAKGKPRLYMLLQTICATGIRVSELKYFTVEAVQNGEITVTAKGKRRTILLPGKLKKRLLQYCERQKIQGGIIFRTRSGRPVDRSNIWSEMKNLCRMASVEPEKVFPHNLRKLFARSFYALEKDIAKLADVLGHSNIETTRIYIMESGMEHRRQMEILDLVI